MKNFKNATQAFEYYYDKIIYEGEVRCNGTKRLKNVMFNIVNPLDSYITTPFRGWDSTYADAEWRWYMSQNRSVEELKKIAPIWDKMHNGDNIVNSNYGYQWNRNRQLDFVIEELLNNPTTRRATLTINDTKDWQLHEFDTPCTQTIMFEIGNDGLLHMTVVMRSNDLWYGFCNDQYTFTELFKLVAANVGLLVGTYTHMAHDLHLYDNKLNKKNDYGK